MGHLSPAAHEIARLYGAAQVNYTDGARRGWFQARDTRAALAVLGALERIGGLDALRATA